MLSPQAYFKKASSILAEAGRPEIAEKQEAYMRNQFLFYGIKAPTFMPIYKKLFKEEGKFTGEELKTFARLCYDADYRELHYLAVEMVQQEVKKQDKDFIHFLTEMITQNSWWDTVDWISKLVGFHFIRFPDLIIPTTRAWMDSDNIWLQRVAIIFQRYKNYPTNEKLLFRYILEVADSKEFFLQKAAGWALRDHSKIHPEHVRQFLKDHPELSSLTKREASKYI